MIVRRFLESLTICRTSAENPKWIGLDLPCCRGPSLHPTEIGGLLLDSRWWSLAGVEDDVMHVNKRLDASTILVTKSKVFNRFFWLFHWMKASKILYADAGVRWAFPCQKLSENSITPELSAKKIHPAFF